MPALKKTDRSIGVVMERLADPKRRHLVRPEDKEAVEKMNKTMQEMARLTLEPIISGPAMAAINHMLDMAERVSPAITMIANNVLPAAQRALDAHTYFEELNKNFVTPLAVLPPQTNIFSAKPIMMRPSYPSTVRIENSDEIARLFAKEIRKNKPVSTVKNTKKSGVGVECIYTGEKLHLYILNFPEIVFEGLRADIVHFFYTDHERGQWKRYEDMRELNAKTSIIREAIEDINARVTKETKIKELITSRPLGVKKNSSKEYRYAL